VLEAVSQMLAELARRHEVRVLYAVESGSRAWGFASPDSDYDVRFLYSHPAQWYLRVFYQRDVIEAQDPGGGSRLKAALADPRMSERQAGGGRFRSARGPLP